MNKNIKKRWVAALRSGDYQQGRFYLQTIDKHGSRFCCLGVLCDLAEQDGVVEQAEPFASEDGEKIHLVYNDPSPTGVDGRTASVLPRAVQKWSGLDSAQPVLHGRHEAYDLIGLNDSGASFECIADIIEEWA